MNKYVEKELKKIKTARNINTKQQKIIVTLSLSLLFILFCSYISNVNYAQIMMLFLVGLIFYFLYINLHFIKLDKFYSKLINELKNKIKDN